MYPASQQASQFVGMLGFSAKAVLPSRTQLNPFRLIQIIAFCDNWRVLKSICGGGLLFLLFAF